MNPTEAIDNNKNLTEAWYQKELEERLKTKGKIANLLRYFSIIFIFSCKIVKYNQSKRDGKVTYNFRPLKSNARAQSQKNLLLDVNKIREKGQIFEKQGISIKALRIHISLKRGYINFWTYQKDTYHLETGSF